MECLRIDMIFYSELIVNVKNFCNFITLTYILSNHFIL